VRRAKLNGVPQAFLYLDPGHDAVDRCDRTLLERSRLRACLRNIDHIHDGQQNSEHQNTSVESAPAMTVNF
jgi:hypothetical protein